mgnify:CR=1 FL=1
MSNAQYTINASGFAVPTAPDVQVFSIRVGGVGGKEVEKVVGWSAALQRCREVEGATEHDITLYGGSMGVEAGLHHVADC